MGKGIKHLVERTDEDYVFRLHKNRVFYVRETLMRRATNVSRSLSISMLLVFALDIPASGMRHASKQGAALPCRAAESVCMLKKGKKCCWIAWGADCEREAGAPGDQHREADAHRQVSPHSGLSGPAGAARQVQGGWLMRMGPKLHSVVPRMDAPGPVMTTTIQSSI